MGLIVRKQGRIDMLDAVRGVAILSMVVYHGLYDIYYIFGYKTALYDLLTVFEPPFAGAFILLCGISCRFSRNNLKRGARLLAFAMLITAGTVLFSRCISPGEEIYFGILHFMGVSVLLFAMAGRLLDRIPRLPALILWLLLFAATYAMPATYQIGFPGLFSFRLPLGLAGNTWLFPLGLPGANFFSADYFPLVPWFFLFLAGTVIGLPIRERRLPEAFYTAHVPLLAAAGRNTLAIYLLHQPVLYGLLYVLLKLAAR